MAVFITAWLAVNGWQLVEIINLKVAVAEMRAEKTNKANHEEQNQTPVVSSSAPAIGSLWKHSEKSEL